MFVAIYSVILCLSAVGAAALIAYVSLRVSTLAGRTEPYVSAGTAALLPSIAFLIVVSAPPSVLFSALIILSVAALSRFGWISPRMQWAIPCGLLVASAALMNLPHIPHVPAPLVHVGFGLFWILFSWSGIRLKSATPLLTLTLTVTLAPLLVAPLLLHGPSSIALDVALILCGLIGTLLIADGYIAVGPAKLPFVVLTGWLIGYTALHGGWIPAIVSVLAWGAMIAYGFERTPILRKNDAFDF